MKTIKDLVTLVKTGKKPIVTFGPSIGDKESYAESGMRARVLSVNGPDIDNVLRIFFAFEEFSDHNITLESSNYYNQKGQAVLTARQAGFYHPEDDMYFEMDENLSGLLTVESDNTTGLYEAFKAEGSSLTYLQWLEAKVIASMATAKPNA